MYVLPPYSPLFFADIFSVDVVNTIYASLSSISKSQKRPFFGSIYLLNNVAHLRMHVLLEPRNKNIMPLLPKPTRDALNSYFRLAKSEYFNSNFMPLLGVLANEPSSGKSGGKAATKEKFIKFFDLLEEVAKRHRIARVLEDDEEWRKTVVDEVVRLVVPNLQQFTTKNKEKEFSKSGYLFSSFYVLLR